MCTGGTDLETVPQLAVPGLFQEAPSPKFMFCWVFFSFLLRVVLLVLSSISCFLPRQLPCYRRHTATALCALAPAFATSVPREIPGPARCSASNYGMLCPCLLQQAPTAHRGAAHCRFMFSQDDLHPPAFGTRVAQEHEEAQSKTVC